MVGTETAPHAVLSVEIAFQNFSKSREIIKTIRLYVVEKWIMNNKDRITSHFDPEDFQTSARDSKINFGELK